MLVLSAEHNKFPSLSNTLRLGAEAVGLVIPAQIDPKGKTSLLAVPPSTLSGIAVGPALVDTLTLVIVGATDLLRPISSKSTNSAIFIVVVLPVL